MAIFDREIVGDEWRVEWLRMRFFHSGANGETRNRRTLLTNTAAKGTRRPGTRSSRRWCVPLVERFVYD